MWPFFLFSTFSSQQPEDAGYTSLLPLSQSSREEEAWLLEARAYRQEFSSCPGERCGHPSALGGPLGIPVRGPVTFLLVPEEDLWLFFTHS